MGTGPAVTSSNSAGFHHLITDSRPWYKNMRQFPHWSLANTNSFEEYRYPTTEPFNRASVCYFLLSKPLVHDPCRLITSSTNGYDGMSLKVHESHSFKFPYSINCAGSMMSMCLKTITFEAIRTRFHRNLILQTVSKLFPSGRMLLTIQPMGKYVFKLLTLIILTSITARTALCHPGWNTHT